MKPPCTIAIIRRIKPLMIVVIVVHGGFIYIFNI